MSAHANDPTQPALVSSGRDGQDPLRAPPGTPWERSVRHFAEMIIAMMIGMVILSLPVGAVAGALGYRDLNAQLPAVATLIMAFEMTVPMALWMGYRGHHRRGVLEMSSVMTVPAIVLVVVAQVGLIGSVGLVSTYHLAMLAAMVGYMAYRRAEYSGALMRY